MRKYTIRYTRQEVVAGTEIPTGNLLRFAVTVTADTQLEALQGFKEDYSGSDMRITSITPHPVLRVVDGLLPTQRGRASW